MPGSSDSVKVAVRVRPFNQREKNANSQCILSMNDKTTTIKNPQNGETKSFAFDYSYWSHDGFRENENGTYEPDTETSHYISQQRLFKDLGQGVLDNAWQGYNAALFAYGQTGSGKSYSMIGYGLNKGIVPITCEELFKVIHENKEENKQLRVYFSMLEIYNEQVRDLLVKEKQPHGGLKIRQNPKLGFYVEGLKQVPVRSYKEIEKLMESGTFNRTTASTNMNATSSRSHMVITIRFEQVIISTNGQSNTRSSDINLVDLAGSERADSTGATGDRLKEGSAINQSLSTLGNVISALADQTTGKKTLVPYRDSVLTKLLQSALGGNSRTIMIAALSPADINYEETLSTLRYADRAKKIQNKAVVNESPTDRLIRELKEENANLLQLLKKQGSGDTTEIQKMLEENQRKMQEMQMSWEQRLEEARKDWERSQHAESAHEDVRYKQYPYITNVNEDPQLSCVIKHIFSKSRTVIGRSGPGDDAIHIRGLGIQPRHVEFLTDGKKTYVTPCSEEAVVFLNGVKVRDKTEIRHQDRLKFGSGSLFLYIGYPLERSADSSKHNYDFDFFIAELAEHEGVSVDITTAENSQDLSNRIIFQDFVDLMPKLAEANAISDELKKHTKFEAIVKSEACHDPAGSAPGKEVLVKVTNTETKKVWIWSLNKFNNRKDLMDDIYNRSVEGENVILTRDKDPFWDPVEDIFLGSCHIMLQGIGYFADTDEHFTIHNYHGKEEAVVQVQIQPCDEKGRITGEEEFILEPKDLIGKPLNILFSLPQCMSVRWINEDHSRGVEFRFTFPFKKPDITKAVWHKSYAELDFKQHYTYKPVTQQILDYFHTNSLVLELWGKQVIDDRQVHSSHTAINNSESESEAEKLRQECEQLRKDNFKLKQSQMKIEERIKLMEMRSINRVDNKNRLTTGKSIKRVTPEIPAAGLDVEFAKALRDFFREMKDVQNGLKEMKDYVSNTKQNIGTNGLKKSFEDHEQNVYSTEKKLDDCLTALKMSATLAMKKTRPTTAAEK